MKLFQIVRRQALPADDHLRIAGQQRDRFEIVQHVILQGIDRAVDDMCAPDAVDQRVAVGRGARDPADADAAPRATDVLDDDRLAEQGPHAFGQDPCQRVDGPASRKRYDQRDWPRRISLRAGEARERGQADRAGGQMQKSTARKCHEISLRMQD